MASAPTSNTIPLEQLSAEGLRDFIRSNRDDVGSIADLSDKALKKLSTAELYALAQRVVVAMPKAGQNRAEAALAQRIQDNSKALSAALALWDKTGLGSDQSVKTKALTQAAAGIIGQLEKSGDNASAYVLKEVEKKFGKNPSASEFLTGLSQLSTLPKKQMLAKGLTSDQVAELAAVLSDRVSELAKTQYAPVLQAQAKRLQDEIEKLRTLDNSLRDQAVKAGLDSTDLEAALMPEMNVPATEPEPSQQTSASDLLNSQEETISEPYIGEYIPGTGPAATIQRKDGVKVTIPASILDNKARLQAIISGKEEVTLTAENIQAMDTQATEAPVSDTANEPDTANDSNSPSALLRDGKISPEDYLAIVGEVSNGMMQKAAPSEQASENAPQDSSGYNPVGQFDFNSFMQSATGSAEAPSDLRFGNAPSTGETSDSMGETSDSYQPGTSSFGGFNVAVPAATSLAALLAFPGGREAVSSAGKAVTKAATKVATKAGKQVASAASDLAKYATKYAPETGRGLADFLGQKGVTKAIKSRAAEMAAPGKATKLAEAAASAAEDAAKRFEEIGRPTARRMEITAMGKRAEAELAKEAEKRLVAQAAKRGVGRVAGALAGPAAGALLTGYTAGDLLDSVGGFALSSAMGDKSYEGGNLSDVYGDFLSQATEGQGQADKERKIDDLIARRKSILNSNLSQSDKLKLSAPLTQELTSLLAQ